MSTPAYVTGFEHGQALVAGAGNGLANAINGTGTASVTASAARTGGFGLRLSSDATNTWKEVNIFTPSAQRLVGSFYWRTTDKPTTQRKNVCYASASPAFMVINYDPSSNKLQAEIASGAGATQLSANTINLNQWYRIDFEFLTNGTTFTINWSIDGVPQTQLTLGSQTATNMTAFFLAVNEATTQDPHGGSWDFDDVVLSVTSGDYPLGEHQVFGETADQANPAEHQSITTTQWQTTPDFSTFTNFASATETVSRGQLNDLDTADGIRMNNTTALAGNARWPVSGYKLGQFAAQANTDEINTNAKIAVRYTPARTGLITSIWVYCDGNGSGTGAGTIRGIVYADAAGPVPGALLGYSDDVTIADGQAAGWVECQLSKPIKITTTDPIWIGVHNGAVATPQLRRATGASPAAEANLPNADTFSDGPEATWSGTGHPPSQTDYSIYAEFDQPESVATSYKPVAVSLITVSREAATGTNNAIFRTLVGASTTDHFNADPGWGTTWNYLRSIMTAKPGGGAWTLADVDVIKFEADSTDASPNIWLSGFYYEVAYALPKPIPPAGISATSTVSGAVSKVSGGSTKAITPAAINATSTVSGAVRVIRRVAPTAISATSTVSGAVIKTARVGGAISATSTVNGAIRVIRRVAPAAISATSTVGGSVAKIFRVVTSAISATSTVSGLVGRRRPISGVISATSTVSGSVAKIFRIIAGQISATSAVSGSVVRRRPISGAISATSTVSGTVTKLARISGAISATSSIAGAVVALRRVAGAVSATSTVSGAITKVARISGAIAASVTVSGAVGRIRPITPAGISATATVSGTIVAVRRVGGAISATATVSGSVRTSTVPLTIAPISATSVVSGSVAKIFRVVPGAISATSSVAGSIVARRRITGAISATSVVSGSMVATRRVAGAVSAVSTVTGSLRRIVHIAGVISAASTVGSSLGVIRSIQLAAISATSTVAGYVGEILPLSGAILATSTVTGVVSYGPVAPVSGAIIATSTVSGRIFTVDPPTHASVAINASGSATISITATGSARVRITCVASAKSLLEA